MADTRIFDLTGLTAPSNGTNLLQIVDTADTTMSSIGTDKKITITNFTSYLASLTQTFTNKSFDTAGTGNVFKINGTQVTDITGTGKVVLQTSPTLITPTLGVAIATSINGIGIAGNSGKTITVNNSLTLAGTDGTTMTFPGSSDTVVTLAASQTITNKTMVATSNTISALAASMFSTGQILRNISNAQNYSWQMGTATATFSANNPATTTVTFGTAFATACDLVLVQPKATSTNAISNYVSNAYSYTSSGCTVETRYIPGNTTDTVTLAYIAIGH